MSNTRVASFWLIALVVFSFCCPELMAQKGRWEGEITLNGLEGRLTCPIIFDLDIKHSGHVNGQVYVYPPNGKVVGMDVIGKRYGDRSVKLEEVRYHDDYEGGVLPEFFRNYQFVYKRSLWNQSLEGYWQERLPNRSDNMRAKGRIILKRPDKDKSKA